MLFIVMWGCACGKVQSLDLVPLPLPQWMYIQRLHYLQWFNITVTVYIRFYETIRADPNFLRGEYV